MVRSWAINVFLAGAVLGTAGCSTIGVGAGGTAAAPAGASLAASGPPVGVAPVSMGAFLEGSAGSKLAEADRTAAFKAETDALTSGDRKTWRGSKGVYGYVLPGPQASGASSAEGAGACRSFTHTIYFGGRPQVGHGSGCQDADGTWRITA